MKLLIVVLNWRTADLTSACLASVARTRSRFSDFELVVTDNDSQDGSFEQLSAFIQEAGYTDWASVRAMPKNGGYCYGNNGGFRDALRSPNPPDYVLLLNPDTEVKEDAIETMVRFMDENPPVGIVGARLEDEDGSPQEAAFRFPSVWSELIDGAKLHLLTEQLKDEDLRYHPPVTETAAVGWVVGAAMMIRREVFDAIGLMDEGYFLYFDEVDFCARAATAGFERWFLPTARVMHHTGAATGISKPNIVSPRRPAYWFESRRRYWLKHKGPTQLLLADLAFLAGFASYRVRQRIQKKPDLDPPKFWRDFLRHSSLVKGSKL